MAIMTLILLLRLMLGGNVVTLQFHLLFGTAVLL